ncbi:MAG TPA: hypothetical protein VFG47_16530 [Geminicoccaceae bacterium]|nr:hypothetical protein [Geminicoccaceae bacterium]
MFRLLIGVVIGILIGVLVIAPNPELGDRVRSAWDQGQRWVAALVSGAEDAAHEAADGVRDATDRAADAVREGADEVREEAPPPPAPPAQR